MGQCQSRNDPDDVNSTAGVLPFPKERAFRSSWPTKLKTLPPKVKKRKTFAKRNISRTFRNRPRLFVQAEGLAAAADDASDDARIDEYAFVSPTYTAETEWENELESDLESAPSSARSSLCNLESVMSASSARTFFASNVTTPLGGLRESTIVEEPEHPEGPSDEESLVYTFPTKPPEEAGPLMPVKWRSKRTVSLRSIGVRPPVAYKTNNASQTLVRPTPSGTTVKPTVKTRFVAATDEASAVDPSTISDFSRLQLQVKLDRKQQKHASRLEKLEDRLQDKQGYKSLWNDYEKIQDDLSSVGTEASLGASSVHSFDLKKTDSWYFDFQDVEFAFESQEPDEGVSQASRSLLSEASMEAQVALFRRKRKERKNKKRAFASSSQSVEATPAPQNRREFSSSRSLDPEATPITRNTVQSDYGPVRRRRGLPVTDMEVSFSSDPKIVPGDAGSVVSDLEDESTWSLGDYKVSRRRTPGSGSSRQGSQQRFHLDATPSIYGISQDDTAYDKEAIQKRIDRLESALCSMNPPASNESIQTESQVVAPVQPTTGKILAVSPHDAPVVKLWPSESTELYTRQNLGSPVPHRQLMDRFDQVGDVTPRSANHMPTETTVKSSLPIKPSSEQVVFDSKDPHTGITESMEQVDLIQRNERSAPDKYTDATVTIKVAPATAKPKPSPEQANKLQRISACLSSEGPNNIITTKNTSVGPTCHGIRYAQSQEFCSSDKSNLCNQKVASAAILETLPFAVKVEQHVCQNEDKRDTDDTAYAKTSDATNVERLLALEETEDWMVDTGLLEEEAEGSKSLAMKKQKAFVVSREKPKLADPFLKRTNAFVISERTSMTEEDVRYNRWTRKSTSANDDFAKAGSAEQKASQCGRVECLEKRSDPVITELPNLTKVDDAKKASRDSLATCKANILATPEAMDTPPLMSDMYGNNAMTSNLSKHLSIDCQAKDFTPKTLFNPQIASMSTEEFLRISEDKMIGRASHREATEYSCTRTSVDEAGGTPDSSQSSTLKTSQSHVLADRVAHQVQEVLTKYRSLEVRRKGE